MGFRGPQPPILPKGGLNNGDAPYNIPEEQSPDCRNVRFGEKRVYKRDGITRYIATAADADAVVGLAQLALSSGTNKQVAVAGDSLVVEDAGAWSSIKGALTITANDDKHVQFAQLTDLLIGTNDVDALWKYSGTGNAAALTGVVANFLCKAITDYKNRIVTLNTSESGTRRPGRFRWSDLNNAESWTAANFNDTLNNAGQVGVGFGKSGDQLFAFFDRSVQEVVATGDSTAPFAFYTVAPEVGSVSGSAIVSVKGTLYFPSYDGIYAMKGGQVEKISDDIDGTWEGLNTNRLDKIVGTHNRRDTEIWFSVSTGAGTQHDRILVFNYKTGVWTEFSGWNANAFGDFFDTEPLHPLLGNYDGVVFETNTGTFLDDTAAIDAYILTKILRLGAGGRKGQVKRLQILAGSEAESGAQLEISNGYSLNLPSNPQQPSLHVGGALWGSAVWGQDVWVGESLQEVFYRPRGHGRHVQFKFRNAQANVGMNLSEVLAHTVTERVGG